MPSQIKEEKDNSELDENRPWDLNESIREMPTNSFGRIFFLNENSGKFSNTDSTYINYEIKTLPLKKC